MTHIIPPQDICLVIQFNRIWRILMAANSLKGKVAVITGASRGIGRAAALALANEGVNIVATARSEDELNTLVEACEVTGVRAIAAAADATVPEDVYSVKAAALEAFGQVDILVNNAGVAKYGPLESNSVEDYEWMMDTNMKSTFLFTQAFVPGMVERKSGNLIIVSSQAGVAGFPNEAVYCASKHAQVGFANAMDGELRPHNVEVSVIAPGGVATTFAFGTGRHEDMEALDGMLAAEDVAEAIVYAAKQSAKSRIMMVGMRPMAEPRYGGA
jgi:NADP-dependent 3-hydroxy acid dehydrogenase YdfG